MNRKLASSLFGIMFGNMKPGGAAGYNPDSYDGRNDADDEEGQQAKDRHSNPNEAVQVRIKDG